MAKLKMKANIQRHELNIETEDGEKIVVFVRVATTGDTIKLANLTAEQERVISKDGVGTKHKWNPYERERYMAFLTVANCNLADENDQPVFRFNDAGTALAMSLSEFAAAWDTCPTFVTDEIMSAVFKTNSQWDYSLPAGEA